MKPRFDMSVKDALDDIVRIRSCYSGYIGAPADHALEALQRDLSATIAAQRLQAEMALSAARRCAERIAG